MKSANPRREEERERASSVYRLQSWQLIHRRQAQRHHSASRRSTRAAAAVCRQPHTRTIRISLQRAAVY